MASEIKRWRGRNANLVDETSFAAEFRRTKNRALIERVADDPRQVAYVEVLAALEATNDILTVVIDNMREIKTERQ